MPPKLEKQPWVWGPKPSFFQRLLLCLCILSHSQHLMPLVVHPWEFQCQGSQCRQCEWRHKVGFKTHGYQWYPVTSATVACTNVKTCRHHQNQKSKNGGSTENCWAKATSYPPSTEGCSVTCHDGLCHVHLSLCLNLKHIIYILFLYINVYIYTYECITIKTHVIGTYIYTLYRQYWHIICYQTTHMYTHACISL